MSNTIILAIILSVAIILTIIALIVVLKKQKKPIKSSIPKKDNVIFFDDLVAVANNKNSTKKDLLDVLKIFNENFYLSQDTAQQYLIFLSKVLTHQNVDKDIFTYFHTNIKPKNPKYKKELETIELKALN